MSQSKFKIGDRIVFLGETDSSFIKNDKYRILSINKFGEYPFNEAHQNDLANTLDNPKILTIKDKNNMTFFLIYTNKGFYDEKTTECGYFPFTFEKKLRKEKLDEIENKNNSKL